MSVDRFAPLWLVALAMIGALKGNPTVASLPVDATLLVYTALMGSLGWAIVVRDNLTVPRQAGKPALLLATFVPPLLWASWSSYGTDKALLLFTVTAACLIGPTVLVRSTEHIHVLMAGVTLVGLAMAASMIAGVDLEESRVGAFSGGALHVGLWASVAAVVCGLWSSASMRRAAFGIPLAAAALWAVSASGTRSGLAGAAAGLVVALVAARRTSWRRARQIVVILPVMAAAMVVGIDRTPEPARDRLTSIVQGEGLDASTTNRLDVWSQTNVLHPLGAGVGDWQETVDTDLTYPHNLFIEVGAEAGWMALAALVVYLAAAVLEAWRRSDLLVGRLLLGALIVLLVNAMTHGDINSQRLMFVIASSSLMLRVRISPMPSSQRPPVTAAASIS